MNTSILRLASRRGKAFRYWDDLNLCHNVGHVSYGNTITYPEYINDHFFFWNFHEHRGGAGGLEVMSHRAEIKEMVRNLYRHQLKWNKRFSGSDEKVA